ncbi:MAG: 50S ribosomal protein L11 methyltransferase [Deinococcales bacterium]
MISFHFKGTFESHEAEVARLWDLGCQGLEERGDELVAYFPEVFDLVAEGFEGRWQEDNTDWLAKYYADLKPIVLDKLIVAAEHCEVVAGGRRVLWLEPGMAFGTGHHETTQMALESLEKHNLKDCSVFDLGTGSGILAIAAMMLGAKQAFGIDNDPITIPIAAENAEINGAKVDFAVGDLSVLPDHGIQDHSFDIFIANIYAEVHAELAQDYKRLLKPGGLLIVTGIMKEKRDIAFKPLSQYFSDLKVMSKGEWLLIEAS